MVAELKLVSPSGLRRAIIHVDMDSFFASCEQQRDPKLKGKPVCIGQERGIATSMSIEAKRAGITRGMKLADIRRVCPECIILPSDYETFGLYCHRMFGIVREYVAALEEYSIDECFGDITGCRKALNMTYDEILWNIKHDIDTKLGTTCSVGLGPSKTLAKIASKWKKPEGITIISGNRAQYFLKDIPIGKVWGIGHQTESRMLKYGIKTALDFAYKKREWVEETFEKPIIETWYELCGTAVKKLSTEPVDTYDTISKRKTITPGSNDKEYVFSHICKRVENACRKARKYNLVSDHCYFGIKTQNFKHHVAEIKFDYPIADPITFIENIRPLFEQMFDPDKYYRTMSFAMVNLRTEQEQGDLFGLQSIQVKRKTLFKVIDEVNEKYGKHSVHVGKSDGAILKGDHQGSRGEPPWRKKPENWLPGETVRRRVGIPYCGLAKA